MTKPIHISAGSAVPDWILTRPPHLFPVFLVGVDVTRETDDTGAPRVTVRPHEPMRQSAMIGVCRSDHDDAGGELAAAPGVALVVNHDVTFQAFLPRFGAEFGTDAWPTIYWAEPGEPIRTIPGVTTPRKFIGHTWTTPGRKP